MGGGRKGGKRGMQQAESEKGGFFRFMLFVKFCYTASKRPNWSRSAAEPVGA